MKALLLKDKMNRKAFELSISAIVIIILGVLVLIGLALFLTGGFKDLKSSTDPFFDTTQSISIKQSCELACQNQDKLTYCCKEYNIDNEKISCEDSRLEIACELNCENFECSNTNFFLNYSINSWPDNRLDLIIFDMKILLIGKEVGKPIHKSKIVPKEEWGSLVSFFADSGILDVSQDDLRECQPPNCPLDGGTSILHIKYRDKETKLIIKDESPESVDKVLNKLLAIIREMERS